MPRFFILKTVWFQVETTTANERKHLEMVSWTVLDLCIVILDRTEGSGHTALHRAENHLNSPPWNVARVLVPPPGLRGVTAEAVSG
jgi:hypothetical protein